MNEPVELAYVTTSVPTGSSSNTEYETPEHEYAKLDTTKPKANATYETSSVEKELVKQAKTIRILVIVCVCLAVAIIIVAATFGALINSLTTRIAIAESSSAKWSLADSEKLVQLEADTSKDRISIDTHESRITTLEQRVIQQSVTMETQRVKIEILESREPSLNLSSTTRLMKLETYLDELNATWTRYRDNKSGFTYYSPSEGPGDNLKFIGNRGNIGGHYNSSTGIFTCQYPGIYVFHLHMIRQSQSPLIRCDMRRNGTMVLYAYGKDNVSDTIVVHLNKGDTVDIGDCSSADEFDGWTSFSGFLLQAD